jgi:hypothetical protein
MQFECPLHVYNIPPLGPVLNQKNPVHVPTTQLPRRLRIYLHVASSVQVLDSNSVRISHLSHTS